MICAWIETSSAETGSSQTMNLGFRRQGARDADALALAAGEFVRVALGGVACEADRVQQLAHPARRAAASPLAVDDQRLGDDLRRPSCAD